MRSLFPASAGSDALSPPRRDVILAAAVVALGLLEVTLAPSIRPKSVALPTELALGAVLAWRRTFPLGTVIAVALLGAVEALGGVPLQSPALPLLANVIAVYALVSEATLERALLGTAIGMAAFAIEVIDQHKSLGNFFFAGIFLGGVWVVGRTVRARTAHAGELEERTVLLEREREDRGRQAAVEERARIARELHDVIAHSVSVMVVQAGAGERLLPRDPDGAMQALRSVQDTGRQALGEMSRLLGILRDHGEEVGLAPQPGISDLGALFEQTRQAGLPVELTVEGQPRPLPPGVELSLYRIVQEALTNTLKHGGRARADVLLRYGQREVTAEIDDDGTGARNGHGGGHGLVGMRERVAVYGGAIEAGPRPGGGYAVRARIPVEPAQ